MTINQTLERITQAVVKTGEMIGENGHMVAYLGKGDRTGTIIATDAPYPRSVYVYRSEIGGRTISTAVLSDSCGVPYENSPSFEGYPVVIGYPPNSKQLHVLHSNGLEGGSATGGQTIIELQIRQAAFTPSANIMDCRLSPDPDNPVSTRVYVNRGWFIQPSTGDLKWFGGDYVDFATEIAALTSGQHQLAAVYLNTETVALGKTTRTAEAGTNKDVYDSTAYDEFVFNLPQIALGAVRLYYGQATPGILEPDFYRNIEPRFPLRAAQTGVKVSTANVTTPTDAELDSAFGQPADVGTGFVGIINDNAGGTNEYLCWSDGTNWFFVSGTKAT